jgi:hypothetical protein
MKHFHLISGILLHFVVVSYKIRSRLSLSAPSCWAMRISNVSGSEFPYNFQLMLVLDGRCKTMIFTHIFSGILNYPKNWLDFDWSKFQLKIYTVDLLCMRWIFEKRFQIQIKNNNDFGSTTPSFIYR